MTLLASSGPHYTGDKTVDGPMWAQSHVMDNPHSLFGIPMPESIFGLHLSVGHMAAMLLAAGFAILIAVLARKAATGRPSRLAGLIEVLVLHIRDDVCVPNMGKEDGHKWAPYFITLFLFIAMMNLIGIIPTGVTATGNVNIPLALALCSFVLMTFVAIAKNGIGGWFHAFIPSGVPTPILIGLVPLEILGVFIKSGALCVRLFANMMAGHLALYVIMSFIYSYGEIVAPVVGPVAIGIYGLELGMALLQAYIFTFLSAIFVGQIFRPDH